MASNAKNLSELLNQDTTVAVGDIADGSVTTAKLANNAVTDAKSTITVSPAAVSDAANTSTGYFDIPSGTTAQRPGSPATGMIRHNTTTGTTEEYRNGAWKSISNVFEASGGTITNQTIGGTLFKVHTFLSSGTFTVSSGTSNIEYLVIAGAGSGGNQHSGGGGAGGFRTNVTGATSGGGGSAESTISVSGGNYSVTVGAGGARNSTLDNGGSSRGNNGGNSSIAFSSAITSTGGGRGGRYSGVNGDAGGSGGGAGGNAISGTATLTNSGTIYGATS